MPYITQERRLDLDPVVDAMVKIDLTMNDITKFLVTLGGLTPGILPTYFPKYRIALKASYFAEAKPNGDINYILFKYGKYHIKPSYNNYKAYIGAIHQAKDTLNSQKYVGPSVMRYVDEYRESAEWVRMKLLMPYEDQKIKENGDV